MVPLRPRPNRQKRGLHLVRLWKRLCREMGKELLLQMSNNDKRIADASSQKRLWKSRKWLQKLRSQQLQCHWWNLPPACTKARLCSQRLDPFGSQVPLWMGQIRNHQLPKPRAKGLGMWQKLGQTLSLTFLAMAHKNPHRWGPSRCWIDLLRCPSRQSLAVLLDFTLLALLPEPSLQHSPVPAPETLMWLSLREVGPRTQSQRSHWQTSMSENLLSQAPSASIDLPWRVLRKEGNICVLPLCAFNTYMLDVCLDVTVHQKCSNLFCGFFLQSKTGWLASFQGQNFKESSHDLSSTPKNQSLCKTYSWPQTTVSSSCTVRTWTQTRTQ